MTTDIFCFYLQNRLIQTSQTGGDGTVILPPLVFLGLAIHNVNDVIREGGGRVAGQKRHQLGSS
jgi:hypothetical protein